MRSRVQYKVFVTKEIALAVYYKLKKAPPAEDVFGLSSSVSLRKALQDRETNKNPLCQIPFARKINFSSYQKPRKKIGWLETIVMMALRTPLI